MRLALDPSDARPLYQQVVDGVREAVARGRLRAGDRLPAVRELAKDLVINPNTIAHAYDVLEREGVTVSRQGAGTFVAQARPRATPQERRRAMAPLIEALLREAVHRGLSREELREAVEDAARRYRLAADGETKEESS